MQHGTNSLIVAGVAVIKWRKYIGDIAGKRHKVSSIRFFSCTRLERLKGGTLWFSWNVATLLDLLPTAVLRF